MLKPLISAIAFLTRIPIPTQINFSKKDWEKSPLHYPFVGVIIGLFLILTAIAVDVFLPVTVIAFSVIVVWIWITGGLHLDGWMDLADGLGSSRSKEQMLEIMKDSRVGAMGVIAAILLIGGKFVFVYELIKSDLYIPLLLAPALARFMLLPAMKYWAYRKNGLADGLGKYITHYTILFHIVWIMVLTYVVTDVTGMVVIFCSGLLNLLFISYIYKKLNVLTGDCYGALIEWSEVSLLFLFLLIERIL